MKRKPKNPVIKHSILSAKSWLSVKDSNNLYIIDCGPKKDSGIEGLNDEWYIEKIIFGKDFSSWDKLPYQQKRDFVKKFHEKGLDEDLKKEIEKAIQALENGNDYEPNHPPKSPLNNKKADSGKGLKIFLWIGGIILALLLIFLIYWKLSKKISKK